MNMHPGRVLQLHDIFSWQLTLPDCHLAQAVSQCAACTNKVKSVLSFCSCTAVDLQIEADVVRGSTLEGFRRLLLLVLLQDNQVLRDGRLQASMLRSAEELLLAHPPESQRDMLLSTWVNLVRLLNSGAAEIQGEDPRAGLQLPCHLVCLLGNGR